MLRLNLSALLLLLSMPFLALSQRTVQGINTGWKFHKGADAPTDPLAKAYWEDVSLPHTWNAEDVMDDEPGYYRGVGWYEKELFIPAGWREKQVYIHFEGASQTADVFVNDKPAGRHIGGYTAFNLNLSGLLRPGKNTLRVKVDNSVDFEISPVGGDFTIYGGIYRDVYLVAVDPNHFDLDNHASSGVFVTTPQVSEESASAHVRGKVSAKRDVHVVTAIYDRDGRKVAETTSKPDREGRFSAEIKNIKTPRLWHPDDPYLYRVVTTLSDAKDGVVFDEVSNPLGFRWFRFDADSGFILNGKPLKLMGANRHQDFKGLGYALPDALHANDIQMLKDMGGNFLRLGHYPQDPAIMEACDRLGILVSAETPPSGNGRAHESEAYAHRILEMQREMIRQSHNHPSVIIWSYMNEVLLTRPPYEEGTPEREQYWKNVRALAQKIEDLCREEDPARYTMLPCDEVIDRYRHAGLLDIPMVIGWNLYKGWYIGGFEDFEKFILDFRKEYPDKPIIISEYGADSDYRLHSFRSAPFDKTQEYAHRFHEAYLPVIAKHPFIAGAAAWVFTDLVSEGRQEATPHLNTKGLLTTDRKPKDVYYLYKAWLAKRPFVKVAGSDWPSRAQCADEGSDVAATQPVAVYSNQGSVSLWANGEPLGAQKTRNGKAVYPVRFKNGKNTLRAVAEDGSEDLITVQFHVIANNLKAEENPFTSLNVSMGDFRMFMDDLTGEAWVPEQAYRPGGWGYVGGRVYRRNEDDSRYGSWRNIRGTPLDAMYQTQRVGLSAFNADVPDGVYEITFHFAELLTSERLEKMVNDLGNNSGDAPGRKDAEKRSFDVVVNDNVFLQNLSPDSYLTPIKAYSSSTRATARNGRGISVRFVAHSGEAVLSGIQLKKIY